MSEKIVWLVGASKTGDRSPLSQTSFGGHTTRDQTCGLTESYIHVKFYIGPSKMIAEELLNSPSETFCVHEKLRGLLNLKEVTRSNTPIDGGLASR